MTEKIIKYSTRDGTGKDIIQDVKIKQYMVHDVTFDCPICHKASTSGIRIKDIVSANFTDWAYVGDHVCPDCADLFSLYFYSYVVDPDGIHLYNVRDLPGALTTAQKTPFMFCVTTSRKKHLFYDAVWNQSNEHYAVNLERETIYTTLERQKELFSFVQCLQTLGATKTAMSEGSIPLAVLQKTGMAALDYLHRELMGREIQIPLYCGQKLDISEQEAICTITSILTR